MTAAATVVAAAAPHRLVICGDAGHPPVVEEVADASPQPAVEPQLTAGGVVALVVATLDVEPLSPTYAVESTVRRYHRRALEELLGQLATVDGTWQQRWEEFERQTTAEPWWRDLTRPESKPAHAPYFNPAFGQLVRHDLVRPSHQWIHGKMLLFLRSLPAWRDPGAAAELTGQYASMSPSPAVVRMGTWLLGCICANTGKGPREVTSDDIVAVRALLKSLGHKQGKSANTLWTAMHGLGWFGDIPPVMPSPRRRLGQQTPEQLVDRFPVPSPQREVLIEYVKTRSAAMDYSSTFNLARQLAGNFWADIAAHHPGLPDFTLTPEQAEAWKTRLRVRRDGQRRQEMLATLFAVRAFYLDIAQWALNDSYWAPWATRCPVNKAELKANHKNRRAVIARHQQRTRELAPLLPALVKAAEDHRRETRANLDAALAAGQGDQVVLDGFKWTVRGVHSPRSVRAVNGLRRRFLGVEEDTAFWIWAVVETLRHSGLRLEEMLELTHLAIQPYTIKPTGETIPLLHILPSKTDEERLIVASPELVHVLSTILSRVRDGNQDVPLTQRWDPHERQLGQPLPHLFVHLWNSNLHLLSPGTVHNCLNALARRAKLTVGGQPVNFTPHDFRRLFATEALANGLPPHIVQVLLGHKSLATTQGYAAIYPQDVIRSHRSFITMRRRTRPSEEYREPTAEEWIEFEAHFVQRKVSLGTCGRGYGTSCQHEHACLRCGLLRPDPAQADRLRDIIANLADRVAEAEQNSWLGEVEGLRISWDAARLKLDQMERQLQRDQHTAVDLGLPRPRPTASRASHGHQGAEGRLQ